MTEIVVKIALFWYCLAVVVTSGGKSHEFRRFVNQLQTGKNPVRSKQLSLHPYRNGDEENVNVAKIAISRMKNSRILDKTADFVPKKKKVYKLNDSIVNKLKAFNLNKFNTTTKQIELKEPSDSFSKNSLLNSLYKNKPVYSVNDSKSSRISGVCYLFYLINFLQFKIIFFNTN